MISLPNSIEISNKLFCLRSCSPVFRILSILPYEIAIKNLESILDIIREAKLGNSTSSNFKLVR